MIFISFLGHYSFASKFHARQFYGTCILSVFLSKIKIQLRKVEFSFCIFSLDADFSFRSVFSLSPTLFLSLSPLLAPFTSNFLPTKKVNCPIKFPSIIFCEKLVITMQKRNEMIAVEEHTFFPLNCRIFVRNGFFVKLAHFMKLNFWVGSPGRVQTDC